LFLLTSCDYDVQKYSVSYSTDSAEKKEAVAGVHEVPRSNVERVVDEVKECPSPVVDKALMERTFRAMALRANRGKFIYWSAEYGNDDKNPANAYAVYVYKGTRYTFWHRPSHEISPGLTMEGMTSVWERPNGSRGQENIDWYGDTGIDGCVNSGSGDKSRYGADEHSVRWNEGFSHRPDEGLVYHYEWQEKYGRALQGLAKTLGVK